MNTQRATSFPPTIKEDLRSRLQEQLSRTLRDRSAKKIGNGRICWIRVEVEAPALPPLLWLEAQPSATRIYWRDRERGGEVAGVGQVDRIYLRQPTSGIAEALSRMKFPEEDFPSNLRYYGGFRFSHHHVPGGEWQPFAAAHLIVPRFELTVQGEMCRFAANLCLDSRHPLEEHLQLFWQEFSSLVFDLPETPPTRPRLWRRRDLPDFPQWESMVQAVLQDFECGRLQKAVLARRTTLDFTAPLSPMGLLQQLQELNPGVFHFGFQFSSGAVFIGSTPERLYRREGNHILSEAVAGTRPRGATPAEDRRLERELLISDKEVREHRLVVESIRGTLQELCRVWEEDRRVSVLKLPRLQHLYARIQGLLHEGVGDARILAALHPTPAVGGLPKEPALERIARLEPFDRGWYAGPVGWIRPDAAEFVVGIRSGLVQGEQLHLYTGAGIVPGSRPAREWQELETKMENFLKALNLT
ncbi:MAG: isochorismate synthase [Calditrichaeota bacterium]|nr:MAG: isochorismate synthase [Calditrichota bacterium]